MDDPKPIDKNLMKQAERLRKQCSINDTSPFAHYEVDGDGFSALEHLIHELGHAVLLRIPLEPGLSDSIEARLNEHLHGSRAHQEACVWVIEFHVFCMLGLDNRMEWQSCVYEACVQEGVTSELMDFTMETWGEELKKHAEHIHSLLIHG